MDFGLMRDCRLLRVAALAVMGILAFLALTACSGEGATESKLRVVTTNNIVADWVRNVGGDNVEVFSLLPVGADPHTYQPGARDVTQIADADLVLSIGLGLEAAWFNELLQNAARDPSRVIELGEGIDPIEFAATHADEVELLEELAHIVHEVEDGEISAEEGLAEIEALLKGMGAMEEHDHDHCHEHEEEDKHDHDHGHEHEDEDEDEHDHGHEHEGEDEDDHGHEHEGEDEDEHDHGHEHEGEDEDEHHHGHEGQHGHQSGVEELTTMVMELIHQVEEGELAPHAAIEAIEGLAEEGEDAHAGHGHGLEDPHFWFDPIRVQVAVNDIAGRLGALDPDHADTYLQNADSYNQELAGLDTWTMSRVSEVPESRRLLVTSHDSFGYFAVRYGFVVVGVVLSTTTDVAPSPADLAELAHEVEEYSVPAIFGETTVTERLARTVAEESGVDLVRLYSGSLGEPGSGADTYISMVRTNVDRIVEALR